MPPRRNTRLHPEVAPTTGPTTGQTRRGRPEIRPVVILVTETPTSSTPNTPPPKSKLTSSADKYDRKPISKREIWK